MLKNLLHCCSQSEFPESYNVLESRVLVMCEEAGINESTEEIISAWIFLPNAILRNPTHSLQCAGSQLVSNLNSPGWSRTDSCLCTVCPISIFLCVSLPVEVQFWCTLITLSSLQKVGPSLHRAISCQQASLLICHGGCFICHQVGCTQGLCCPTFLAAVQKIAITL